MHYIWEIRGWNFCRKRRFEGVITELRLICWLLFVAQIQTKELASDPRVPSKVCKGLLKIFPNKMCFSRKHISEYNSKLKLYFKETKDFQNIEVRLKGMKVQEAGFRTKKLCKNIIYSNLRKCIIFETEYLHFQLSEHS